MSSHLLRRLGATLLCLFAACASNAHELSIAHLSIQAPSGSSEFELELDLAVRDLALSLPLDRNRDERVLWGELLEAREEIEALVASGLHLGDRAGACPLQTERFGLRRYDDGAYASLVMRGRCRSGQDVRLRYALLFEQDPQHRALVSVHRGDGVHVAIARTDARQLEVPSAAGNPFAGFMREGVGHILSGYDHLAFLLSLLLAAPLLRAAAGWQAATEWRPVAWRSIGLVTAFTAAHSLTLSAAALGWVRPSSFWVESLIAFSVMLAALNNIWPVVLRRLWLVGFGFGLVHGLGFAGALLETGLPPQSRLLALLGFNVGVELGQLAVVAALLPVLFALRKWRHYPNLVLRGFSVVLAVLAGHWLWQRLLG